MTSKILTLLSVVLLLSACGGEAESKKTLTIFAASSLTDALEEMKTAYEKKYEDVEVRLNFGASSALATQLNEGATADVFASANLAQMEQVVLQDEPDLLAENELVLLVYRDSSIQTLEDLTGEGVSLVLASPEVPIRVYTDSLLAALNAAFGDDFQARVMKHVISEEANVRQAVLKIGLGEADAGFAYRTDVTADIQDEVRVIEIPAEYQVITQLYIGAVSESGRSFVEFALSEDGQAILKKWGFLPVYE